MVPDASCAAGFFQACFNYSNCTSPVVKWGAHCQHSFSRSEAVGCGWCRDLHTAAIPGLATTWLSAASALLLFVSFVWVLRRNNRNHRLALAGATADIITVTWYTRILDGVMVWAVGWAVYKFFRSPGGASGAWHYAATALVRAYSAALEIFVFVLLASNGVGARDFATAGACASVGAAVPLAFAAYSIGIASAAADGSGSGSSEGEELGGRALAEGRGDPDLSPRELRFSAAVYSLLCVFIGATAAYVRLRNKEEGADRRSFFPMATFLFAANLGTALGFGALHHLGADWGLCLADLTNMAYFACFAPVMYSVLEVDARYWTNPDGCDATQLQYEFAHGQSAGLLLRSSDSAAAPSSSPSSPTSLSGSGRSTGSADWGFAAAAAGGGGGGGASPRAGGKAVAAVRGRLVDNHCLAFVGALSDGANGRVDEYTFNGRPVAIKTLTVRHIGPLEARKFKREATVFAALDHPHVVRFVGVRINPPEVGFVMEFCNGGDLFQSLQHLACLNRDNPRWRAADEEDERNRCSDSLPFNPIHIARQVASAMAYLQEPQPGRPHAVVHRDLKSLNVMLTDADATEEGSGKLTAKLCDFGDAVSTIAPDAWNLGAGVFEHSADESHGTPAWAAPEALARAAPHLKTDVYSFGVVLWELLTWSPPFLVVPDEEARKVAQELEELRVEWAAQRQQRLRKKVQLQSAASAKGSDKGRVVEWLTASTLSSAAQRAENNGTGCDTDSNLSSALLTPDSSSDVSAALRPYASEASSTADEAALSDAPGRPRAMPRAGEATTKLILRHNEEAKAWVLRRGARPPMPADLPPALESLLVDCWKHSADQRPSFREVHDRLEAHDAQVSNGRFPFTLPLRFPPTASRTTH